MKKKTITKMVGCLFTLYCIVLVYILFLYGTRVGNPLNLKLFSRAHFQMVNVIPLKTLLTFLNRLGDSTINANTVILNFTANALMFIPMGMALPVLLEKRFDRLWKLLLFTVGVVLLVEILQFITFCGSADIDDLILNTAGCAMGYGIISIRPIRRLLCLDR